MKSKKKLEIQEKYLLCLKYNMKQQPSQESAKVLLWYDEIHMYEQYAIVKKQRQNCRYSQKPINFVMSFLLN